MRTGRTAWNKRSGYAQRWAVIHWQVSVALYAGPTPAGAPGQKRARLLPGNERLGDRQQHTGIGRRCAVHHGKEKPLRLGYLDRAVRVPGYERARLPSDERFRDSRAIATQTVLKLCSKGFHYA